MFYPKNGSHAVVHKHHHISVANITLKKKKNYLGLNELRANIK